MSAEQKTTRFVWPPRPIEDQPEREITTVSGQSGLLDVFETQLLGRTGLSFERRSRQLGWQPDAIEDYCVRCGGSVGPHESDGEGCPTCRRKRLPWQRAIRLGAYAGHLQVSIRDLKFRAWRQTGVELGRCMGDRLAWHLERANTEPSDAVIVPVPCHWTRRVRFGVDHTLVLARAASGQCGVPVRRLLTRRPGPRQLQVSATERSRNVSRAFQKRRFGRLQAPKLVIVLDDVRTTGATLRACCRTIRSGYPVESVWVVTAGVTPMRNRRERANRLEGAERSIPVMAVQEN